MSVDQLENIDESGGNGTVLRAVPSQVLAEILQWAQALPLWEQHAIRLLFKHHDLQPAHLDELYDFACLESQLISGAISLLPLSTDDLPIAMSSKEMTLCAIKNVQRVNALSSDQRLEIGQTLTLVYGDNGAGKSGYARVLKKACRSRAAEEILPNVYKPEAVEHPASAIFEFTTDGRVEESEWVNGSKSPSWFGRFAVFDSRCGNVYVCEKSEPQLMPFGLDVLPRLASVLETIRFKLNEVASRPVVSIDAITACVKPETSVAKLIDSFATNPRKEFIERQAVFTETDKALLGESQKHLHQLELTSPDELRRNLSKKLFYMDDLTNKLSAIQHTLAENKIVELKNGIEKLQALDMAVSISGELEFADATLAGVGTSAWKELLIAAENYSTKVAYPDQKFPAPDGKCVLCHQALSQDAYSRLLHFHSFIRNETASKRDVADKQVKTQWQEIDQLDLKIPDYEKSLEGCLRECELNQVHSFYDACLRFRRDLKFQSNSLDLKINPADLTIPTCVREARKRLQEELSALNGVETNAAAIAETSLTVDELLAKKVLAENWPLVKQHIEELENRSLYRSAVEKIRTTHVSTKSKALQLKFVSEQFKTLLADELNKAGVGRVNPSVSEKGKAGKVIRSLEVNCEESISPSLIFSEGERTAVGLACFMAELGTEDETSGVIFDDPVTSLDHEVRTSIAGRLVQEATNRQVIIFTHDLVFFREIMCEAVKAQVKPTVQCLSRLGGRSGIITAKPPWDATSVKDRIKHLDEILEKATILEKNNDVQGVLDVLENFYKRLRETWERIVEECLFAGVIYRFERPVHTQQLVDATVDDESVAAVFEGMSIASQRLHDNAAGAGSYSVSLEDARKDLSRIDECVVQQKKKKAEVENRRKHLKGKIK